MLRHLFKLIWNKKGAHSLLIIEIWASFLVLFGVLSLIIFNVGNYMQPIGFEYKNVWTLDLNNNQDTTEVAAKMQRIMDRIRSYPEVQSASRMSSNTPFSASQMSERFEYKKAGVQTDKYVADQDFSKTLDLPLLSGKWFQPQDWVAKYIPVVINKKMQTAIFMDENPIGKLIKRDEKSSYKIVGVVDKFKAKGEFMSDNAAIFIMHDKESEWDKNVLIKTKPGTDANFEAKLVRDIAGMTKDWGIEVSYLTEMRKNRHNLTLVPVMIFLIISGFLLTNVALGLFGILNLSIAKRKNEIGLRRAMGATERNVTIQFLGEIWVLAVLSMIVGIIFAVQFPLMNVFDIESRVYILAIFVAILIIFLIVTMCAWYPSRQASRIHPAVALHED